MDDLIDEHYTNLNNSRKRLGKKISYNTLEFQDEFIQKKLI